MPAKTKTYYELQIDQLVRDHYLPQHLYVQVRQSKAFMKQYLAEKIELKAISSEAYMSRFHYIRTFRKVYGISPRQFLKDLRLNKAKELLKQGLEVARVCEEVGYDSITTFTNNFKKATGHSPKEYLRLNKSNPE